MAGLVLIGAVVPAAAGVEEWRAEWPRTDFSRHAVPFEEILSGGPPKDAIPAIDDPRFRGVEDATDLADREPVIALDIAGDVRAYPLRVMIWHEIVNDVVGGVPVAVTYCPLCNSAVVFDRRLAGRSGKARVLEFGVTGKLRHSDLVMYDRQTQSWWQQFLGEAIVGELTGARLSLVPARLESFARFKARGASGRVLVPRNPGVRPYGRNPYEKYDSAPRPFLYAGSLPKGIAPLERVVVVDRTAWSLALLRDRKTIEADDLRLGWSPGQASALDTERVAEGWDVGNVVVQRKTARGYVDVPYDVSFAFAFHAMVPNGTIHVK